MGRIHDYADVAVCVMCFRNLQVLKKLIARWLRVHMNLNTSINIMEENKVLINDVKRIKTCDFSNIIFSS